MRSQLRAFVLLFTAVVMLGWSAQEAVAQSCPAPSNVGITLPNIGSQSNLDNYCELCGTGWVTARVYYYGNSNDPITNIVIRQDLSVPGLQPIPGTTSVSLSGGGPTPPAPTPTLSGGQWTWNFSSYQLEPFGNSQGSARWLQIRYQVRRVNGASEEGLLAAGKSITSSVSYNSTAGDFCDTDTELDTLPFRRPEVNVIKDGRNVDAGQTGWSDPVYGHNNDDIIWRIRVQNNGLAALQDLRLDDLMQAGNLVINYACPTAASAATIAGNNGGGPIPAGCISAGNTVGNFTVANPFGYTGGNTNFPNGGATNGFSRNLNGRDIDVQPGSTQEVLYLVGKVTANGSCISGGRTNTVSDVQFGCEADGNGIGGLTASGDTAVLRTYHGDVNSQLTITRSFTGVNTVGSTTTSTQPVGARGLVTLTIANNTGGTVTDIVLNDVLPPQYVMDPTYWSGAGGTTKTLPVRTSGGNAPIVGESSITPAYGNAYPGMINRITWENPQGSLTSPSQDPMQNTAPRFRLWSTAAHPSFPNQIHMLRHGDVVRVTFPIVLISQNRNALEPYDLVADLDVTPESPGTSTDPDPTRLLSNQLSASYNTFCPSQGNDGAGRFAWNNYGNTNINAFPEDLDVAITDINNNPGAVFILTNDPNQTLPLRVRLTNNGGHSATGYRTFVTFGATMQVMSAPAGCSVVTPSGSPLQPNPWKVWIRPTPIPAQSTVYQCTGPAITPSQTVNLDFAVIKSSNAARVALDDLTFRADVVGEIVLHDGTPLWFPTPITRPDTQLDRANNYSLDGVRQKVIGFNLIKTLQVCNENDPASSEPGPNTKPAQRVEIGEECRYRVQSGGWFGFETPGFLYIAVEDVELMDNLPTGQGYVSSTDPYPTSTDQIQGISLMGANVPPTPNGLIAPGAPFSWRFNQAQRITRLDEWFEASVTTRVLNNPIDNRAVPNVHAANSQNVLTSDFTAIFADENSVEHPYRLGPSVVGYPNPPIRTEDLKITEPLLEVVKEVCNETIYGAGLACTNWTTAASGGDAFNTYIYRLTVRNRPADNGIARSPAYDVVVTDTLDPSGLACVMPFDTDGLDNDADGTDGEEEGTVTGAATGDCPSGRNGVITFRHEHSTGLLRINPGQSVRLYYRVDFDNDAAPLQLFTNRAIASYDSLAGSTNVSGNQTIDPRPNSDIGGARVYTSAQASASVRMIPVDTEPKRITRTSNTPPAPAPGPQPVVVGEEIEYQLTTLLPVALLRNFVIRDELPPGLLCAEAPTLNLGPTGPYAEAGFDPATPVAPTCDGDVVEWNFGDRRITQGTTPDNRYPFSIRFIARVENTPLTNEAVVLANGDPATSVTARYIDEGMNPVEITFGQVDVVVREPVLALTKSFAPTANADAGDQLPVTVTVRNNGTANAYNVRVLDNLTGLNLTFVPGSVSGTSPPSVDVSGGNKYPIFHWAPDDPIAPGATRTFTFHVTVDIGAQPHEVLENTIQASWTSLPSRDTSLTLGRQIGPNGDPTGMRIGALPNAGDAVNDYEAEASADIAMRTPALNKTDQNPLLPPTIGAHKRFLLEIALPEGTTRDVSISDDLNMGSESYVLARDANFNVAYEFVGIASIDGQAVVNGPTQDDSVFNAVPAHGATGTVTWDIGTVVTQSEDDLAVQAVTPAIRIYYFARINNDLATDAGDTVQNGAALTYRNGETDVPMILNDSTPPIIVVEPRVTATKRLTNVTPGKNALDPLELGDTAQYVVTIINTGGSTAHDVNIVDTPPLELQLDAGYTPTATIDDVPVVGFVAMPAGAPAGPLVWGRGNGDGSLDLPANSFIELTYRMRVTAEPIAGNTIDNNVWVDWTSLDDANAYERTGAGCPTITPPNDYCYGPALAEGIPWPVGPPDTLKANTQPTASIGEPFRYRITIPAAPYAAPLYDVRITDNLATSNAVLEFVSVNKISGPGDWVPVNSGSGTDVVIEAPPNGIDIPAGQQAVIEITVRLADDPANIAGLTFTNTATYTYNRLNGNIASAAVGDPGTTEPMTIVEPELTLDKSGPPQMRRGQPGRFTLNVHNVSAARAHRVVLTDRLPNIADAGTGMGGMCAQQPAGFTAQLYQADGTTPVGAPLAEGTDYAVAFTPAASGDAYCTVTVTMQTPATAIAPDQRLIVTYQAWLDTTTEQDAELTNIAGATQWYSADPSAPNTTPRTYTRAPTDGTPSTVDHEDAYTVLANFPVVRFQKYVANVTRGTDPAAVATPGDRLRYRLRVENVSDVPVDGFSLYDELDALNNPQQPAFAPNTLTLISVPAGADVANTNPVGGARGTGVLDVRSLNLAAQGAPGAIVEVVFEVTLAPVIANGSFVYNQARVMTGSYPLALSDDPNVNGQDDPTVSGDEDRTRVRITSAPYFRIEKISSYLGADTNVLLAGDRLRYTITVRNVGTDHATGTVLRDAIPANTTYVVGSTTLNGTVVPDGANGRAPLVDGIPIYAPEDTTPGAMRADATPNATNVATLTFEVVVYPDVLDGTVISNQAFVSAVSGGVVDLPSDDPRTAIVNDPTRDVVGNSPLLYAEKYAVLQIDGGSPGIVDPGDVLRYTIRIHNNGPLPATEVMLRDVVPQYTTWVANSLTLNGLPVGQPDGGVSPLIAGINVSSSDLTPPLPGAGEGVISRREMATVQFDLRVNDGTAPGTQIVNQAAVYSAELPNLLTDGDGNPATGPEPTIVIVGNIQQLRVSKQVAVVGGGPAIAGATLEYLVTATNISTVPAQYVVIRDDLSVPFPGYLNYVDQSATLNGTQVGVTFAGTLITADYSTSYGPLQPGQSAVLRFRAVINPTLAIGTTITNTGVVYWDNPPRTASASVSIDVGGVVGVGTLAGSVWHDANFDKVADSAERLLDGWSVELYRNERLVHSTVTDTNGAYRIASIAPNYLNGDRYELRFVAPGAGSSTAKLGRAHSNFNNDLQRVADIVIFAGGNYQNVNLPIEPNGVVYNTITRSPVEGATVTMLNAGSQTPLPASCFYDPGQQNQVTLAYGYYKFDLTFADPACPSGGSYIIDAVPPVVGYIPGPSQIIPPASGAATAPFSVPACPASADDAIMTTAQYCEVQASEFAPPIAVRARAAGTRYRMHFAFDNSFVPGSAQIFNNHIPLDPDLQGVLQLSKTTPMLNVTRGQMIPYTITFTNVTDVPLFDVAILDRFPAGFRYIEGSARLDGVPLEPTLVGRELRWNDLVVYGKARHSIVLLLAVGAGVSEGEFTNRAQALHALTNGPLSNEGSATVRVIPDATFDCTDLTGKVFDDANRNGIQDTGERGLSGVRVVSARGLTATTDAFGRFHITCAVVPREGRGSNFILKLDDRTLPAGYRASTDQVRVQRATRGKTLRFNFGASIHRVIGLDIADAVFEPGTASMRPQWQPRMSLLIEELQKGPAVLRLSYLADLEDQRLVDQRIEAVKKEVMQSWKGLAAECREQRGVEPPSFCYQLTIEPEVFWRRGGPRKQAAVPGNGQVDE